MNKADQGLVVELLEGRALLTAVVGLLAANEVVVFDSTAPERIVARRTIAMPAGQTLVAIDFAPNPPALQGVTAGHQFYTIDLETGAGGARAGWRRDRQREQAGAGHRDRDAVEARADCGEDPCAGARLEARPAEGAGGSLAGSAP